MPIEEGRRVWQILDWRYDDERVYQRCETHYRDSRVERVDGYRVTYEYAGRQYVT